MARALGESTGTTSDHLRLLARHGLVREVESASRRERWWCKVPLDLRFPPVDEDTPAAERDAHLDLHRQRLTEDLAQLSRLVKLDDPADLAWTRMSRSSIRVTRAQLDELGAELRALMLKYATPNAGQPTTGGPAAEASTADKATELISCACTPSASRAPSRMPLSIWRGEQPDRDLPVVGRQAARHPPTLRLPIDSQGSFGTCQRYVPKNSTSCVYPQ